MFQYELPRYLPTADELPCSDDTPVDNELQELILSLLKSILQILWADRMDWFFGVDAQEVMSKAEGVGGEVDYVLRRVEVSLDSHTLTVPIAWLQTDDAVECLLGREVVFDKFDIEFKQRDRQIIFKYRGDS